MLKSLFAELASRGIDLYLADVHAPVLEQARQAGLAGSVAEDHVLPTVDAAVQRIERTGPHAPANGWRAKRPPS